MRRKTLHVTGGLAKLGCKVITRTSARPLGSSDSPNGVQSIPNFAKPLKRYRQAGDSVMRQRSAKSRKMNKNSNLYKYGI